MPADERPTFHQVSGAFFGAAAVASIPVALIVFGPLVLPPYEGLASAVMQIGFGALLIVLMWGLAIIPAGPIASSGGYFIAMRLVWLAPIVGFVASWAFRRILSEGGLVGMAHPDDGAPLETSGEG